MEVADGELRDQLGMSYHNSELPQVCTPGFGRERPREDGENEAFTGKNSSVSCTMRSGRSQPSFRGDLHSNPAGVDDVISKAERCRIHKIDRRTL